LGSGFSSLVARTGNGPADGDHRAGPLARIAKAGSESHARAIVETKALCLTLALSRPGQQISGIQAVTQESVDACSGPRRMTVAMTGLPAYCSPVSPLVCFLARSISVTAIRISARVFRSGASSIACFSAGP
jgi:hypothetical protein